jgi:hypothetical protein
MERGIGAILRETRKRRGIELDEVEATTRIRLRYLRAIEDEDWAVLPGDVYARGFIRTYASFLGLDGERLAGEYREAVEGGRSAPDRVRELAPGPVRHAGGSPRRSLPGGGLVAVAGVILLALVAILVLPGDEDGSEPGAPAQQGAKGLVEDAGDQPATPAPDRAGVSVRVVAGAEVWVCILGEGGERLVDGQVLEAGAEEGPFHSGSFTVSFGNGEVSMLVDGKEAEIPATPSPLGYAIDAEGKMTQLPESARPTCT